MAIWPVLTAAAVQKHLPESAPYTDKSHMKLHRKGLRSTTTIANSKSHKAKVKAALEKIETNRDINPPHTVETQNQMFCYNGSMNIKGGTIYIDFTGKFPIRSMDGMVAIFIVYNWTTNKIIATPKNNMKEETIVECFKHNIEYLSKRGFKPVLNIIDNFA